FFFFCTAPTHPEISPLSLHDALPIWSHLAPKRERAKSSARQAWTSRCRDDSHFDLKSFESLGHWKGNASGKICHRHVTRISHLRSEEHTSELQSRSDLVCRLLLEKKK